ncbi:MAG: hypothetical protein E7487_01875 [Ruminococcaceae bacterium]|nr:hypothetical protein [Oscillospiraceae bacterium]
MKKLTLVALLLLSLLFVAAAAVLLVSQSNHPNISESSQSLSSETSESANLSETSENSETDFHHSEDSSVPDFSSDESESTPDSNTPSLESSSTPELESSAADLSSSESKAPSESSSQPEPEDSASQSEPENSTPAIPTQVDTSGYVFTDKVPASPAVDNSYFDDALFIGDSITEGIKSYNLMSNTTVISNVGISLFNVATRQCINTGDGTRITIPQAMKQHPNAKKIYIMLGVNGLNGTTVEQFTNLYGNFIDIAKGTHPHAQIYIISMFPINETKFYNSGYPKGITNAQIDKFNHELMKLSTAKGVHFLYVAECIKEPNGSLSANVTGDGMHIGPAYYERWFKYMREHTVS